MTATGDDFATFKSHFGPDDRGFGYIKIMVRRDGVVMCDESRDLCEDIDDNFCVDNMIDNNSLFRLGTRCPNVPSSCSAPGSDLMCPS